MSFVTCIGCISLGARLIKSALVASRESREYQCVMKINPPMSARDAKRFNSHCVKICMHSFVAHARQEATCVC
jgi:hypothetical protein